MTTNRFAPSGLLLKLLIFSSPSSLLRCHVSIHVSTSVSFRVCYLSCLASLFSFVGRGMKGPRRGHVRNTTAASYGRDCNGRLYHNQTSNWHFTQVLYYACEVFSLCTSNTCELTRSNHTTVGRSRGTFRVNAPMPPHVSNRHHSKPPLVAIRLPSKPPLVAIRSHHSSPLEATNRRLSSPFEATTRRHSKPLNHQLKSTFSLFSQTVATAQDPEQIVDILSIAVQTLQKHLHSH